MNAAELSGFFFLDTNIFVYSFDDTAQNKRRIAHTIIQEALYSQQGVISAQVIQEFLNVALRKFVQPMTVSEGRQYLNTVLMPLCQHIPSIQFYNRALLLREETGYSFYDALILAAAIDIGCTTLYSEDLQHGQQVHGLRIINPFRT